MTFDKTRSMTTLDNQQHKGKESEMATKEVFGNGVTFHHNPFYM